MRFTKPTSYLMAAGLAAGAAGAGAGPAGAADDDLADLYEVTIDVTNLAPADGTFSTPYWVGIHDGSFDLYDLGAPAPVPLERIAEDGTIDPLSTAFVTSGAGVDGVVAGPDGPIGPGGSGTVTLVVDVDEGTPLYLSYASMVLPSNDTFVANGDPTTHLLFDADGDFVGEDFVVSGAEALDAGTEVNDEATQTTAFFGQAAPDTGTPEGGVVTPATGFIPGGPILSDPTFAAADYTADGYDIASIEVGATKANPKVAAFLRTDLVDPMPTFQAIGGTRLLLGEDGTIDVDVATYGVRNVVDVEIRLGAPGEVGEVVAVIAEDHVDTPRRIERFSAEITDADLVGPLAGTTTLDLYQAISDGKAFVNVTSGAFTGGVLRADLDLRSLRG